MNTQATQHPPSAIEVLAEAMNYADGDSDSDQEIAEVIANIWLPVFRSKQNLDMALDALRLSHESGNARDMCGRYLEVIWGMK
ncbi:hypothetical protein [Limnohabitans sp. Jir72]|uniref:hypothetical protein n=1 Tax=Limnohabitans sp. Jir72 TaxID=1977909 RepID=UPI000D3BF529|nr:hypothetical protein [Limnohabitans sp. Jir72]PUE27968.1 hypothetical protein B9Z52_14950 [Limnohabitans sp. Jir72]